MTHTKDEALKLAPEALEDAKALLNTTSPAAPVEHKCLCKDKCLHAGSFGQCKGLPSVLAQPAPVPLTDDARGLLVVEHLGPNALLHKPMSIYDAFHMGIDAAEAAHGITKDQP
jgi:hypothetical protein